MEIVQHLSCDYSTAPSCQNGNSKKGLKCDPETFTIKTSPVKGINEMNAFLLFFNLKLSQAPKT